MTFYVIEGYFLADIYLPVAQTPRQIIVISHGLGSDRTSFAYLAEHLASYGFVVAVPEHPGSNSKQHTSIIRRDNKSSY